MIPIENLPLSKERKGLLNHRVPLRLDQPIQIILRRFCSTIPFIASITTDSSLESPLHPQPEVQPLGTPQSFRLHLSSSIDEKVNEETKYKEEQHLFIERLLKEAQIQGDNTIRTYRDILLQSRVTEEDVELINEDRLIKSGFNVFDAAKIARVAQSSSK